MPARKPDPRTPKPQRQPVDLFDLLDVAVRRDPNFTPEPFYVIKVADWQKLIGFLHQKLTSEDYAKLPGMGIQLQRYDFLPDEPEPEG